MPDIYVDVDTAVTVPVNILQLMDDTTFKDIEEAVAYNAAGMDLNWNFVTSAGVQSQTNVTPTTSGLHDWTHVGNGMYKIEIPTAAGDINNTEEGYGWFTGVCDGVLPWRGPTICFRAAGLNDKQCDSAYDANRGLAGTALPAATPGAAGGVFIAGTNAATVITSAGGTALTLSSSGTNGHGLACSGNGTGEGISATGGAEGHGIEALGGATSGDGIHAEAQTDGDGLQVVGANNGSGINADGAGTGDGINAASGASGSAAGIQITSASGDGITISAAGDGVSIAGVAHGVKIVASGGTGLEIDGTLFGIECDASAGPGFHIGGTTFGIEATASGGPALSCVASAGNNSGIVATKAGSGYDIDADIHGTLDTVTAVTNAVTTDSASRTASKADVSSLAIEANVEGHVDTALASINLDHLLKSAVDTSLANTVHDNSVMGYALATSSVANFVRTTDALQSVHDQIATQCMVAIGLEDVATGTDVANAHSTTNGKIDALNNFDPANDTVVNVTTVGTVTNAVVTDAASRTASKADVSALATAAALATVDGNVDAILADTGTDGVVVAAASKMGYSVSTIADGAIGAAVVADIFSTTTIAEAYSADAAAGTPAQLLYLILQGISEFAITSTTKTVKKLDGSTTAATYTLDDDTTPTSITRSG